MLRYADDYAVREQFNDQYENDVGDGSSPTRSKTHHHHPYPPVLILAVTVNIGDAVN